MNWNSTVIATIVVLFTAGCAKTPVRTTQPSSSTWLWRDSAASATTARSAPMPPFTFVEEDTDGDSPKFLVADAEGTRWQVKLGPEAQTEAAAVRILSAIGYVAEETYFLEQMRVAGIERQTRGREFITGGTVRNAKLEARRTTVRRGDTWDWARNPFVGTIELDALRALMVVFNNYDARTDNNRIVEVRDANRQETLYIVADLGASFGAVGGLGGTRSKGNLNHYRSSPFIERVADGRVYFAYRTRPQGWAKTLFVLNPFYTSGELKKERDLAQVPVTAARWLGNRLAALPPTMLRDAFDDAGYPPDIAAGFVGALVDRINRLSRL